MTSSLKGFAAIMLIALALIVWIWIQSMTTGAPSISVPRVILVVTVIPAQAIDASDHASNKHGWLVAQSIVDCISKNGPYMGMKFRDRNGRFYIPCLLPDGSIGLGIFGKDGSNISAYVPGDGSWEHVKNYILQRAARFTGALPF